MRAMKLVGKDWVFQQFVLWQSQLLRILNSVSKRIGQQNGSRTSCSGSVSVTLI